MATSYKFYKNSNSGEIIMHQMFSGLSFNHPDYYYDFNRKAIPKPDLTGFVEISEKKFNKESKRK